MGGKGYSLRCAAKYKSGPSFGSWNCRYPGTLEHEGKGYCKLHHPPTIWDRKFRRAESKPEQIVQIKYTNYRGKTTIRTIKPRRFYWGSTDWHLESQWLLQAYDFGKKADRTFAMKDISYWKPDEGETT